MISANGTPPSNSWALRLRSAIPGRERWEIEALEGSPEVGRELERALSGHPGIVQVTADPVSGRILIAYAVEGPRPEVDRLIRDCLDAWSRYGPSTPTASASPTLPSPADRERSPLLRTIKGTLPGREVLIAASCLSAASFAVRFVQGLLFVSAIDGGGTGSATPGRRAGSGTRLAVTGGLGLLLMGIDVWVQHHRRRLWRGLGQATQQRLRARLVSRIGRQDLAFFDAHGTGQLMELVSQDTAQIGEFVGRAGDQAIEKGLSIVASGILLVSASPRLAFFSCLPLPLVILPSRFLGKKAAGNYARKGELAGQFGQMLENVLGGIIDVKGFTAERREARRLHETSRAMSEASLEAATVSSLESGLAQGIFTAGFYLTALYGGRLAARGAIAQSEYFRVLYLLPGLLDAAHGLAEINALYHGATAAAERVAAVLEVRPRIRGGPVRLSRSKVRGEIVFENVSFGYDPSVNVLEDVSFRLRPGETLAIVGRTGSGKTTLVRLLMRFYDVGSGRILLDGRDIRELRLQDLRASIGLVTQDVFLFQGTVMENVRYGRPQASAGQVAEALREAEASELLRPQSGGLEAEVGERGRKLSGGERQRVAIARALLKDAPLLVLDEVTSHLDYQTEFAVKRSIRQAMRGKSVLMIAHRLSTVRDADTILVIDGGRIRERGTHDELLTRGGLYASLWRYSTAAGDAAH